MRVDVIGMELFKTPSGQTTEHRHLGTRLRFLLRAEDYRATSPDPWPRGLPHNGGAKPLVPVPTRARPPPKHARDAAALHGRLSTTLPRRVKVPVKQSRAC